MIFSFVSCCVAFLIPFTPNSIRADVSRSMCFLLRWFHIFAALYFAWLRVQLRTRKKQIHAVVEMRLPAWEGWIKTACLLHSIATEKRKWRTSMVASVKTQQMWILDVYIFTWEEKGTTITRKSQDFVLRQCRRRRILKQVHVTRQSSVADKCSRRKVQVPSCVESMNDGAFIYFSSSRSTNISHFWLLSHLARRRHRSRRTTSSACGMR